MTILEKNLERVVAKGGFKSKADAMQKAGYSSRTARTPKKSKVWPTLLEKYLPDNKLLEKHSEALEATKWNDFTGEREADHITRLKGVDIGYKVKGKYIPDTINQQFNVGEMSVQFVREDDAK